MAHNQDAVTNMMCASAREGLMIEVTKIQLGNNPDMAAQVAALGGAVNKSLAQAAGNPEARNLPNANAHETKIG